jgi:glycosyltransferase involved in cell wall biosynthesis
MPPVLSVIVPCHNERSTVAELLKRVLAVPIQKEIIVVDDASTDGSPEIVEEIVRREPVVRLLRQEKNQGKGAALRRGFSEAHGEIVIVQDADLEYDPDDWPVLLQPILEGKADACFGSRFLGGPHRVLYYWHSVGNRALTTYSNMLTNLNLTDMETCYKAIRGDLARSFVGRLTSDRFGFEPEITARLAQAGARIYEVPISYAGRTYSEGKKIGWRDGMAAIWHITRCNLSR